MPRTDSLPFGTTALRISAGIIVWAVHFGAIYGYTGLACARLDAESADLWRGLVPWVIALTTVLAAAAALAFAMPVLRSRRRAPFVEWMSGWIAVLALLAIVLEASAVLWVPACG